MGPLGGVILFVSAALLVVSLRNLYASPSRFGLIWGRAGMVFFASLSAFGCWQSYRSRHAVIYEFYDLPVIASGTNEVTIHKPGMLRGYCARLVLREDKTPVPSSLREKLRTCKWEIPGQEVQWDVSTPNVWDHALFDQESQDDPLVLRYTVTDETRPLLSQSLLEVTGYSGQINLARIGAGYAQGFMILFLIAFLFCAFGVTLQRQRMRRQPTAPAPSTSGPPAP